MYSNFNKCHLFILDYSPALVLGFNTIGEMLYLAYKERIYLEHMSQVETRIGTQPIK